MFLFLLLGARRSGVSYDPLIPRETTEPKRGSTPNSSSSDRKGNTISNHARNDRRSVSPNIMRERRRSVTPSSVDEGEEKPQRARRSGVAYSSIHPREPKPAQKPSDNHKEKTGKAGRPARNCRKRSYNYDDEASDPDELIELSDSDDNAAGDDNSGEKGSKYMLGFSQS